MTSKDIKIMPKEDFRKMQLLQLDMLKELDRVCRKHNIKYAITCGTLLGAIRHKGYIPWDDDADIAMLREEYDKFSKVANELDQGICFFQDHDNDPEYLWGYGKLRRSGTICQRAGQEHLGGKSGVFIDIFPMDEVPGSVIGQIIQDLKCFFLRKVLYARVGRISERGIAKLVYRVMAFFSVDWVYTNAKKMQYKHYKTNNRRVRILLFPSFGKLNFKHPLKERYSMPREWFDNLGEYDFEDARFYGTKDYESFLNYMYKNYRELPPEDKREPHAPFSSYSFMVEPGQRFVE